MLPSMMPVRDMSTGSSLIGWVLDIPDSGMEVAATIHSFHPGPEQTAQYCRKGEFKK